MIQATHVYNNTNICILIPLGNQLHVTKHIFQIQCPCGFFWCVFLFPNNALLFIGKTTQDAVRLSCCQEIMIESIIAGRF